MVRTRFFSSRVSDPPPPSQKKIVHRGKGKEKNVIWANIGHWATEILKLCLLKKMSFLIILMISMLMKGNVEIIGVNSLKMTSVQEWYNKTLGTYIITLVTLSFVTHNPALSLLSRYIVVVNQLHIFCWMSSEFPKIEVVKYVKKNSAYKVKVKFMVNNNNICKYEYTIRLL